MKTKRISIYILLLLIIAVAWPSAAYARDLRDDRVVFGGTFTLNEGETLEGNLIVLAGTARVEDDATVQGDLVLLGGSVTLDGTVTGSLIGIGGAVRMNETALVEGDLSVFAASLRREDGARVNGEVITGLDGSATFDFPDQIQIPETPPQPSFNVNFSPVVDFFWSIFRMFIWAFLAVLAVMLLPVPIERVSQAAIREPIMTGGAGLVTAILAPFALLALTLTLILIPVTIVAVLALGLLWVFGMISIGLVLGKRIADLLKQEWAPAISAGVGTLVLMFVLIAFDALVPCVGWIPRTIVGLWGLGAVLMTRVGSRGYPTTVMAVASVKSEMPANLSHEEVDLPSDGFSEQDEGNVSEESGN